MWIHVWDNWNTVIINLSWPQIHTWLTCLTWLQKLQSEYSTILHSNFERSKPQLTRNRSPDQQKNSTAWSCSESPLKKIWEITIKFPATKNITIINIQPTYQDISRWNIIKQISRSSLFQPVPTQIYTSSRELWSIALTPCAMCVHGRCSRDHLGRILGMKNQWKPGDFNWI